MQLDNVTQKCFKSVYLRTKQRMVHFLYEPVIACTALIFKILWFQTCDKYEIDLWPDRI